MEAAFGYILSGIVGAFTTTVPVYILLRKGNADIRKQNAELVLQVKQGTQSIDEQGKINTEAAWKRIIDEKDKEVVRLQARDDEQEVKLTDLLNRHIECKQNEARQDERSKNLTERCDRQDGDIKALTNKILKLERLLRNQPDADQGSGNGSTEPGHSQ